MFLLLGYGISNQSISRYFDYLKINYIIYDDSLYKNEIDFDEVNCIIKSGSVSNNHFIIEEAKNRKIKIISDLELFYNFSKNKKMIVVTGTNGKSTTVSLVKKIIGKDIDLGGNIGIPLFDFVKSKKDIVIESSSYMNEYIDKFKAKYYCITNIYPNHLEHHDSFEKYVEAKIKILKNISKCDYLIYNYDDLLLRRIVSNLECYKVPFSKKEKVKGVYIFKNSIYLNMRKIIDVNEIKLLGEHNLENIMASISICYSYGIDQFEIKKGIIKFNGIEHRLEYLFTKNNIKVYNDSKSTNFLALKNALNSFKDKKVLLIVGGSIKEDDISILDDSIFNIKKAVICGENKEKLKEYFEKNKIDYDIYSSLKEALNNKNDFYKNDIDVILFSPGAPSFDQFKNFEARGRFFKKTML